MAVLTLPVDQRVIDIDSRRFASIEKALVELVTNSDDSYTRLERMGLPVAGTIGVSYERHQNGAVLTVADQGEGMVLERMRSVLSYGGAHSLLARGEAGGRGYFGRGLKQAVFGLGHGWIESLQEGRYCRVDLFRSESGSYYYDDWDGDRPAGPADYERLQVPPGENGTKVTIVVENPQTNIPYFRSLVTAITNNIYLRDILARRTVNLANMNPGRRKQTVLPLQYVEPDADLILGPEAPGRFLFGGGEYFFTLTLKKSRSENLVLKGDERTSGLLVVAGTAVLDCQFFRFENQLGTEFLFGTVLCPALADMLAAGRPVISDEREGLNLKDPFVAAFANAVSEMIAGPVKNEQLRLSHLDHATTSLRTKTMIGNLLQRANKIAAEELGILLPPGPGSGKYGPYETGRPAVLRFSTPFYYRKVGRPFHVTMLVGREQLMGQELLSFVYELPPGIRAEPAPEAMAVSDLPEDGRFVWQAVGLEVGARGRIGVVCGPYSAFCEIVIAEQAGEKSFPNPSGRPPAVWDRDNSADLFLGYELRNLDNDMDRAAYSPGERLILINTEAPTVRLYVDGQGRFKDGARLLLVELFLDVIAEEMARRYVDRTTRQGDRDAYRQVKLDLIRRYGVEIHQALAGE